MKIVIKSIPIEKLKPAAYNPRRLTDENQLALLEKSIKEDGYVEPLVWNQKTGNLVAGHQRLEIFKKLKVKAVDVSVINVSPEVEKRLNIRLNKQVGEWDYLKLSEIMTELDTGSFDMDLTGFDSYELENMANYINPKFENKDKKISAFDLKHTCPKCGFEFDDK